MQQLKIFVAGRDVCRVVMLLSKRNVFKEECTWMSMRSHPVRSIDESFMFSSPSFVRIGMVQAQRRKEWSLLELISEEWLVRVEPPVKGDLLR
jgi:hypothetical protein